MKIVITGGTGALGRRLISDFLTAGIPKIRVISRDEHKHTQLEQQFGKDHVQCFVADIRDQDRLIDVFYGCNVVVHAAALKKVDGTPYNLEEHRKTNIQGTVNVLRAAMAAGVQRLITVSSDKAVAPANGYGLSKAWAELETVNFNANCYPRGMRASCVRYGNVFDSTGSVIQIWNKTISEKKAIQVTDLEMTRFHLTLAQASIFVRTALQRMLGGEIFVPKLPSYKLRHLLQAVLLGGQEFELIGRRPGGEKLAELLIGEEEVTRTLDDGWAYLVIPTMRTWGSEPYPGKSVEHDLVYRSNKNDRWLSVEELRKLVLETQEFHA